MFLYLVRHGEPLSVDLDPRRPLSKRGLRDVHRIGEFLAGGGDVRVERIFHSPKQRALETAQALAEYVNPAEGVLEAEGLLPMDDPSDWAYKVSQTRGDTMLVGHLPFMARLASLLLCGKFDAVDVDFQTGGVVCLEREVSGGWILKWSVNSVLLG
ncbi:MAG: phosphohistidine phosphatase SixA [Candidatus Hydrothermarchaeales archaeon]